MMVREDSDRAGSIKVMTESTANPVTRYAGSTLRWRYVLPIGVILALLVFGFFAYRVWPSEQQASVAGTPQLASAETLEEHYGISVTLVGITASGGIVDVRLKVLDVDKARGTLQDDKNMPVLNVDGSTIAPMMRDSAIQDQDLEVSKIYYILYGNPPGIVKPGTPVSVVIGDLVLEPITAQ